MLLTRQGLIMEQNKTHFGLKPLKKIKKPIWFAVYVFHSVASNYDIMNDVNVNGDPSGMETVYFLHRWQNPVTKVLDIAGGTGDMTWL